MTPMRARLIGLVRLTIAVIEDCSIQVLHIQMDGKRHGKACAADIFSISSWNS